MRTSVRRVRFLAGALVSFAALAGTAGAQAASASSATSAGTTTVAGTALDVTPYAGYMMFGNFIDGPLGTSLSSSASPVYGAQLAMTLMPGVKVIGNLAHASGDLKVGIPFLGGVNAGTTSALMADGGLELSMPTTGRSVAYAPFVQGGVGVTHWNVNLGSSLLQTSSTNLTGNVGAGVDLMLGPSMALRLMAKDYIGKFDFKQATSLDINGKTANNFALTAGVRLSF